MPGSRDRTAVRAAVALLLAAAAWAAAVIAAPALVRTARPASPALLASLAVYGAGGLVCHQRAERSFHTAGLRWPVCARCAGLYVGAGAGAWLVLLSRRRWRHMTPGSTATVLAILLMAAAPTAASWLAERLGLASPGNGLRAALAAPLGLTVAFVLAHVWRTAEGVGQVR